MGGFMYILSKIGIIRIYSLRLPKVVESIFASSSTICLSLIFHGIIIMHNSLFDFIHIKDAFISNSLKGL